MARPTLRERISRRTYVNKARCWMWLGCIQSRGYGVVSVNGRRELTHRAAYVAWKGEIPEGLQLDHVCHTEDLTCKGGTSCPHRRCVNPDHLEPVTHGENHRRALPVGSPGNLRRECIRGHRLAEPGQPCQGCPPPVEYADPLDIDWAVWAEQLNEYYGRARI